MICGMCTLLLSIIESFAGFCLPKLNQCRLLTNNECTPTDNSTTNMHIDVRLLFFEKQASYSVLLQVFEQSYTLFHIPPYSIPRGAGFEAS